jgi:hypothetical protein
MGSRCATLKRVERLARIVAAWLLCLMAGQPVMAALIAAGQSYHGLLPEGQRAHACCKRKALTQTGSAITTDSTCGQACCCKLAPSTEKPFAAADSPSQSSAHTLELLAAGSERSGFASALDRIHWQRPPPSSR